MKIPVIFSLGIKNQFDVFLAETESTFIEMKDQALNSRGKDMHTPFKRGKVVTERGFKSEEV